MFGVFRTILALLVVVNHFSGLRFTSAPAVFGFFMLSGFLMTLLTNKQFKGRSGAFAIDRFFRIYPMYWATMAITISLSTYPSLPAFAWLEQIFLGLQFTDPQFLIPIAWAVANEVVMYALICLGISSTPRRAIIWLAASAAITTSIFISNAMIGSHDMIYDLQHLYRSPWIASLPFAMGAVLFHVKESCTIARARTSIVILIAAAASTIFLMIFGGVAYFDWNRGDLMMIGVHLSLVPLAAILIVLFQLGETHDRAFDTLVGRFSYPIYLSQMLSFGIVTSKLGFDVASSLTLAATVVTITVAISGALIILVDIPSQALKRLVIATTTVDPPNRVQIPIDA